MKYSFIGATLAAVACATLAGCGGVDIWPLGGEKSQERSRVPVNATIYRCSGGKVFYVRYLEEGAAWLILPEREVRLDKVAGTRYSNGIAVLEINGAAATLADGSANSYSDCKAAAPTEK